MLIRTSPDETPFCPRTLGGPTDPLHLIHNRTLDAFYNATERGEDDEMPENAQRAYSAASYEVLTDRMDLYYEVISTTHFGHAQVVSAWYFKCRICGLILPAQARAA